MPGCNQINKRRPKLTQLMRRTRQSVKHATFTTPAAVVERRNAELGAEHQVSTGPGSAAIISIASPTGDGSQLRCVRNGRMGKHNTMTRPIPLGRKKVKQLLQALRNQARARESDEGDVWMGDAPGGSSSSRSKRVEHGPGPAFPPPVRDGVGTLLGAPCPA